MESWIKIAINAAVLVVPLLLAVVFTAAKHMGQKITVGSFYVANREVATITVALSVSAAWVWTVALFVVPQKVYELGVVALVALGFVNAASLLLLAVLVPRVRQLCNDRQLTLPQFVGMRDGKRTEMVFTAGVLGVQVYSVITHLLGAGLLLQFMPGDIDRPTLILVLALAFLIVAAMRGMQSSIVADILKYAAVFGVVLLAVIATAKTGGFTALMGGVTGKRPPGSGVIDAAVLWQFAIPVSAALLSAVAMDDQLYQRGFAARSHPRRAFVIAAALFLPIVLGMGTLGFLAANPALGISITNNQLVNFLVIQEILPDFPLYLVVTAFMVSLIASGGAALHAAGNVGAKNVVQVIRPSLPDKHLVFVSRATMLVTLALGTIAALSGVGLFELWIGWGMFRAVLFFPLIALIMVRREVIPTVFPWIVAGLVITGTAFCWFILLGHSIGASSGEAIVVAWAGTLAIFLVALSRRALAVT